MVRPEDLDKLEYAWSARLRRSNGEEFNIWYTAWPMLKRFAHEIVSVSSDYPKCKIRR